MRLPLDLAAAGAARIDYPSLCAGLRAVQASTPTARASRTLGAALPRAASPLSGIGGVDRRARYAVLPAAAPVAGRRHGKET